MVLKPRGEHYRSQLPTTSDALAVIEIADSSLPYDRGRKLRLYANCGVPEFWLINIPEKQIEAYRRPQGDRYTAQHVARVGDKLSLEAFPEEAFEASEIL